MLLQMMGLLISFLLMVVMVLVGVAFLTLLERKVLGYIQLRKGPNKVGLMGILQPFSDAIKLFSKEYIFPSLSNLIVYYYSPVFSFMLIFTLWMVCPYIWMFVDYNVGFMFLMVCLSLSVYGIMVAGWGSSSSYSLLGSMRAVAQTISYEVSLSFIFLGLLLLVGSMKLVDFLGYQSDVWFIFCWLPGFIMMFTSMLAETNRTPFDFAEGESELVSGFNVEYSSGGFALIFLAEYSSIMFMSMLAGLLFFGYMYMYMLVFFSYMFIWIRGCLPRFRYDKLMSLCWKVFLPVSLFYMIFFGGVKVFFMMN